METREILLQVRKKESLENELLVLRSEILKAVIQSKQDVFDRYIKVDWPKLHKDMRTELK